MDTKGQSMLKSVFRANIYDADVTKFFNEHQNIEKITIEHINGHGYRLLVYPLKKQQSENITISVYDLSFDGDLHLFKKNYPTFLLPNASDLKTKYINRIKNITERDTTYTLKTTLRSDSTTHFFEFYAESKNIYPERNQPHLKADMLTFTKKIEQHFQSWKPIAPSDSLIVLTGIIEKNGIMGNITLLVGETSPYSNKLIEAILKEANPWLPVLYASKRTEWPVRISLRLNRDQTLKIQIR